MGSGLAAYTLVRELRKRSPDIPLTVITADAGHYYSKPQLSTALAHGKTADQLILFAAERYAQQFQFRLRAQTTVTAIYPQNHTCQTSAGLIPYRQLVLAVGAEPLRLPHSGHVWQVNDLADYRAFRAAIAGKHHVGIIGAGLVGCEFANDLLQAGYQVTVVAPEIYPLARLVPASVGEFLQQCLAEKGLQWHLGRQVQAVEAHSLMLDNGNILNVDGVLAAVGLRPCVQLAQQAGLDIQGGILTDTYLRTSQPDIYALGDCAAVAGQWLPYIAPLSIGARALAATLAGKLTPVVYPPMPVYVKTSLCPVVALPPALVSEQQVRWEIEKKAEGVQALCYNLNNKLCGFALAGQAVAQAMDLLKQC